MRPLAFLPPPEFDPSNVSAPDLGFDDRKAIVKTLTYTAKAVISGQIEPKAGSTVAYLADCALRAIQSGADVERIERLERQQQAESALPFEQSESSITFEEEESEQERNERDLAAIMQRIVDEQTGEGAADTGQAAAQKPDPSKKEEN